jgi:hypothetical protein
MSEMASTKPYGIAKRTMWEAYELVKTNRGAAAVDEGPMAETSQFMFTSSCSVASAPKWPIRHPFLWANSIY